MRGSPRLLKIISGGQTGVDQAALRAAAAAGIPIGGWCPPGRLCEDGVIPDVFPLIETPEDRISAALDVPRSQRTEWNVRDSDASLVLRPAGMVQEDRGSRWAIECASRYRKPVLICDPADPGEAVRVLDWLDLNDVRRLSVGGPSERTCPGVGGLAERFLRELFELARD